MISLIAETMTGVFSPPFRRKEFFQQLYFVANKSLIIILFCVSFAAIVTILESSFHMKLVIQNDSMVPGFAALLILRELGAILTALLLTSRVGAGYASEVGTMQITEQVDAFKMLGIDPVNYLVVPRFLACVLGCMMLTIIANMTCIFSAIIVSQHYLGYTPSMFLTSMDRFVQFQDMVFAAIKGACFGGVIPIVACYFGFRCQQGAEGVGRATTNTVVVASIAIIVIDFILSYTFSYLY
ncbi:organic solvent ABC transporter permease [Bdellovibrio bacteriovorus]|uniref:Organic solvent ABC transporter permease n=1 Tax=Bdellovibrio bacteriovorus TaxID=959 RepID=A0A161PQI4_BDEBC|nr:ABC transporter permease [Bdellovibrio bacteriovorus]KYG68883.1 organic solvent ABC transporter permease [Bdellovibrio bacteriovorus]